MGIRNLGAVKQLQEPNNVTCHAESKFSEGLGSSISASSHSQAEMSNSQEPLYLQERGRGEVSTFNSATVKQLQEPNNVTYPVASIAGAQVCAPYSDHCKISSVARFRNKFGMTSPSRADLRTDGSPDSEKIEHSVRKHKCETLRAWSKAKTGMSVAKAEQQSTETLSFRCWCEGCRFTRGCRMKQKRSAFTLAEVLITLGIIGIVAALTLPMLTAHYRKRVIETRLKKFYSTINQAIELSEVKNGPKEHWAYCADGYGEKLSSCEEWYNVYLKNYLKTVDVKHFESSNMPATIAYFADGSAVVIKNGYDFYFYPGAKDFNEERFSSYDEDGNVQRADSGTKFFAFQFFPAHLNEEHIYHEGKGVEPYRVLRCQKNEDGVKECPQFTRELLLTDEKYGCNPTAQYKVYCTALIQMNNWQIPDDYPLKY